jgi:hypothetical protein
MKSYWVVRALPASALVVAMGLATGCSAKDKLTDCDIGAKIDAFSDSINGLVTVSADMRMTLVTACSKITGGSFTKTEATDMDVKTACDKASAEIKANFSGKASVELVPGKCEINAQAQLDCEGSCDVNATCDPGSIEARCTEGQLSVECKGECTGELTCEGSANLAVECEAQCNGTCSGSCSGTCNGTCSGTCDVKNADGSCAGKCTGTCEGSCSASCSGTCKGSCTYDANATATCDATARCKGTCSVEGTAPKCEAELREPSCEADADCQAACKGQASFKADCTPPTIVIKGSVDADFAARVEANLPAIVEVSYQAELAAKAAGDVSSKGQAVLSAAADVPACALKVAGQIGGQFRAAADAALSVQASVTVSASVSGSATTG